MTELMIAVERAIRPVRAGARVKDRIREELLAHLTAVYEAERAALGDDRLALAQVVRRFGDPADLTRELQATVGRGGRGDAAVEGWFGRRAGESELRYAVRLAGSLFLFYAAFMTAVTMAGVARWPWADAGTVFRVMLVFVSVLCASLVPVMVAYFRVRGAVCGGPGVTRSRPRAAAWAVGGGSVAGGAALAFCLLNGLAPADCLALLPGWGVGAAVVAAVLAGHARVNGPRQIRHAEWERLTVAN